MSSSRSSSVDPVTGLSFFTLYKRDNTVTAIIAVCILTATGIICLVCFLRVYMGVMWREDHRNGRGRDEHQAEGGLEDEQIKSIPHRLYDPQVDGEHECAVCIEQFCAGNVVKVLPSCGHIFHQECVDKWLSVRLTCPVCRISLRPRDPADAKEGLQPEMDPELGESRHVSVGGRSQDEHHNGSSSSR